MAGLPNDLWDRVYRLEVGTGDEVITFDGFSRPGMKDEDGNTVTQHPANIQFNVSVSTSGAADVATIKIYGLGRGDRFGGGTGTLDRIFQTYESVKLTAGWRNNYGVIFEGGLYNVAIGRDGPESSITMQCRSIGNEWQSAYINRAWPEGTRPGRIIEDVAKTFGLPVEIIGNFDDFPALPRGISKTRSSKLYMNDLARDYLFSWKVTSQKVVVTRDGAVRDADPYRFYLSRFTGMIGTPRVRERGIDVTAKMIPQIAVSDSLIVENVTTENTFAAPFTARYRDTIGAGEYIARGIQHVGDFEGDAWDTTINGWDYRYGEFIQRTGQS